MKHKSTKSKTKSTTPKKCPHCGLPVKKIRGRNTYYCKEHGFVSASSIGKKSVVDRMLRSVGLR